MKLSRLHFAAPIPLCGTHRREQLFDVVDGWLIERDDAGDFRISGHGVDFMTDGFVSWVPDWSVKPVKVETGPGLADTKPGKRKRS